MPANLTQEYKRAEAAFRKAREPRERLECLNLMLRTIPKHKGTERLQADIKTRIKQLGEELSTARKGAGRRGPSHVVRPEGAAQIALVGPPNVGKSALHARLTGSHSEVAPYPFTTAEPVAGMLPWEDIHFQLVDLPPIAREHRLPWIGNALQPAHGCMLVVDMQEPDCIESVEAVIDLLRQMRITLVASCEREGEGTGGTPGEEALPDPFAVRLPTLLVANSLGRCPDPDGELEALQELLGTSFPIMAVSAVTGQGCDEIGAWWFRALDVVRVYSKVPGRPPDMSQPFTIRRGDAVRDVARLVHRDVASELKFARIWSGALQGQQVGRDYLLSDGDVVELHA